MLSKAKHFKDYVKADQILRTADPVQAKRMGKTIHNFQAEIWKDVQKSYMETGLRTKFNQIPALAEALKATNLKTLIKANPNDILGCWIIHK